MGTKFLVSALIEFDDEKSDPMNAQEVEWLIRHALPTETLIQYEVRLPVPSHECVIEEIRHVFVSFVNRI